MTAPKKPAIPLKATIVAAGLCIGGMLSVAQAQTTTTTPAAPSATAAPSTSPAPAAVTTTAAPSRTTAAPVSGANSFTEGEARRRIEDKGFGQVADLKLDEKGVWRGTASKDGKSVAVALDYQGNIVSQ
jgi:hypothetical protein